MESSVIMCVNNTYILFNKIEYDQINNHVVVINEVHKKIGIYPVYCLKRAGGHGHFLTILIS